MTETQFTSKLVKELRRRLPGAMIFKHADGYSAGIPDISISFESKTTWWEAKMITNKQIFEPLQLAILKKLYGNYIIWNPKIKSGYIISPFMAPIIKDLTNPYIFDNLVERILQEAKP